MVSLKSSLFIMTAALCCVCLLSDFLGLPCVHQSGMTALMWAVKGNCSRSVERLLDGGANTEIRDKVCNAMSCNVMPCHAMSCHVMQCHAMSCNVMPCHVMSCHIMSCHVMPCYRLSPTPIWSSLHVLSDCIGLLPIDDQVGYTALRHATEMPDYRSDNSVMMVLLTRGARTDTVDMVRCAVRWNDVISMKPSKIQINIDLAWPIDWR